jgi:hypothetical protein
MRKIYMKVFPAHPASEVGIHLLQAADSLKRSIFVASKYRDIKNSTTMVLLKDESSFARLKLAHRLILDEVFGDE